jgi:hypothetical protein
MAFPKKGLRKITVDGVKYGYKVTGNDGWIGFSIGLRKENGQLLTGSFSYNSNRVTNFEKNGTISSWSLFQRIKITPDTVRQVIEYGLKNGWDPQSKGQLNLGNMDDKVGLNLKKETPFPDPIAIGLEAGQVVLFFTEAKTGITLKPNKKWYLGEGEIYHVFDSLEEGKEFAREAVRADSEVECTILAARDKAVFFVGLLGEEVLG